MRAANGADLQMTRTEFLSLMLAPAVPGPGKTYTVVTPGTHPGIVFSASELDALRLRTKVAGWRDAWSRVRSLCRDGFSNRAHRKQAAGREASASPNNSKRMALVYQIEQDEALVGAPSCVRERLPAPST